ncbi:MAG: hypothetical protein ACKO3W_05150, partial [bacterium]
LRPARPEDAANPIELDRDSEVCRFVDQPDEPTLALMEAAIGRDVVLVERSDLCVVGFGDRLNAAIDLAELAADERVVTEHRLEDIADVGDRASICI